MNDIRELLLGGAVTPDHAPENLGEITELAQLLIERERRVAQVEAMLKEAKEETRQISEQLLPEAMRSIQLEELKMEDGTVIKCEDFYNGHISQANQEEAHAWLREHEHGDLIKNEVSFSFGKGQEEDAEAFLDMVRKWNGPKGEMKAKEGVHHSTLNAFVKQELEAGRELPDCISVFQGHRARIKAPKKR